MVSREQSVTIETAYVAVFSSVWWCTRPTRFSGLVRSDFPMIGRGARLYCKMFGRASHLVRGSVCAEQCS